MVRRRPSGAKPRLPLPANDRPVWRLPIARQALPNGALTPTPFQAPATSYGTPLKRPTPALYVPKGLKPSALGGWGAKALRFAPYWFFIETAIDLLPPLFPARSPGDGRGIPLAPNVGWWKKTHGYYTSSASAYPVRMNNIYQSLTNYGGYIDNQAISVQGAIQIAPLSHWTACGWWRKNLTGSVRYANYARFIRVTSAFGASDVGWWPAPTPAIGPAPLVPPFGPMTGAPNPPPFRALPHRGVNPGLGPGTQSARGPAPAAPTPPIRRGWPTLGLGSGTPVIGFPPGGAPAKPSPPPPGTKERKLTHLYQNPLIRIPLQAVGLSTEFGDLVKALWEALPPEERYGYYELHYRDKKTGEIKTYWKQRKKPLLKHMLRDLYENWDNPEFDAAKAVENVWNERAIDALYAQPGRFLKRKVYSQDWWQLPVGIHFGPIL